MVKQGTKRVQVSYTKEQWRMIENFKGELGSEDAEIVRNITLAWLAEKSMISDAAKRKSLKSNLT